jgi:type III restriction enzyme
MLDEPKATRRMHALAQAVEESSHLGSLLERALEDDTSEIDVWARLHLHDLEIRYDGGTYNPDFIAAAKDQRWVIETKADRDLERENVQAKRQAAQRWANHVSAAEQVTEQWHYLLVAELDLRQARGDRQALISAAGL